MAANNEVMNRFPLWEQAWKENLPAVDEQITQFCDNCAGDPVQNMVGLQEHITSWFDDQDLDDKTLAEFEKVKADPDYLENQIGGRLSYLTQQGATAPRMLQAGAAGMDNPRPNPSGRTKPNDPDQERGAGAPEYPPRYPPEVNPGKTGTPHPGQPGELPTKGPRADEPVGPKRDAPTGNPPSGPTPGTRQPGGPDSTAPTR
jgi:hypothetical protein